MQRNLRRSNFGGLDVLYTILPTNVYNVQVQENERKRRRGDLDGLDVLYHTASYQPGAGLSFSAGWVDDSDDDPMSPYAQEYQFK